MTLVCPACNKANQAAAACERCGCELSRLHEIANAAESRLAAATTALATRDWPGALAEAERSWRLLRCGESARVAFLAAAAAGEGARALRWRDRAAEF